MTDTADTKETISKHADVVKVTKLLALPQQLNQRLDALRKLGCEVTYTLAKKGALTEEYHDVNVTGPADVVDPTWRKMEQDLGMRFSGTR